MNDRLKSTVTAPVILFVYNRPEHTRTTLESLKKNGLSQQSDLFIFSDGAKGSADQDPVDRVRRIIRGVTGFRSVTVIEREQNWGLAKSIIAGVTEIFQRYDQVIVLEDDLETTPQFLTYMNEALSFYRDDRAAFSIGAYQFPEKTMKISRNYPFDTFASSRCCSWGWATWKDRWLRVDWEMNYFKDFLADKKKQDQFNRGGPDLTGMLIQQKEGHIDSWAIRFCYAHFENNMRCIYPTKSLVRNMGLDHSGVHCGPDSRRTHSNLDEGFCPKKFCPAGAVDPGIAAAFCKPFQPQEEQPRFLERVLKKTAQKVRRVFG